ncbi:MAG: hypothetical protein ACOC9H_01115 [Gemmatimonadota bacterium]
MMETQRDTIAREQADIGQLVHENYVDEVKPWLDHLSPVAGLFDTIGDQGYDLIGEKLVSAAESTYSGGGMATDGNLPDHQYVDPVRWETIPARSYIRRAVDNFVQALGRQPGAFEEFFARVQDQMLDVYERMQTRHIHGSSDATVCKVSSRTAGDEFVVKDGYGYDGAAPCMFVEPGMLLALLDASDSFSVIGVGTVDTVEYNTSGTTATITFTEDIDAASDAAADDVFVFPTTDDTSARHFVTERGLAPNGLLNILDPDSDQTTFLNVNETEHQRWAPVRQASDDFGHVEIMEFLAHIAAKSNSPVSVETHVLTMQEGVYIELAKDLLPFQQQSQLGRELAGGWNAVRIGDFECVKDHYHIPDVVYAHCPEDYWNIDLDGEANVFSEDGSMFQRLADYDGKEWYMRHYNQRGANRRNRCGALTGVPNPNQSRYDAQPTSA